MPTLELTIIPSQTSKTFAECRQFIDDDLTPQTVSNVLLTMVDVAARVWIYARQRGVELPPFDAFTRMAMQCVEGYADITKNGASVVPSDPVAH